MNNIRKQKGQSLIEVIVAMAVFALVSAVLSTMVVGSFTSLIQGGEHTEAEMLAQEGIEAVRAIKDRAWNENIYSQSAVSTTSDSWVFDGEGTTEQIGKYTRDITFSDVCRDSSDDIVDCPGDYTDVQSKQVTVTVSWEAREGINNSIQKTSYITNWDTDMWPQSDWAGGSGQSIWSNITMYDSDDNGVYVGTAGEAVLDQTLTSQAYTIWPFNVPSNYTYDSGKIEVTSSLAQLVSTGGGGSGNLINSGFDNTGDTSYDWPFTTAENYTYNSDKIEVTGGQAQLAIDNSIFRVTEYFLDVGIFTGTTYDLTLDQDLKDNYFVIIQGSDGDGTSNNNRGADEDYVSLVSDPNGTGDLSASGANNTIGLYRDNAVNSWTGVVTVVECLADCDGAGFNLLGVERTVYSGTSESGTDTSAVSWTDIGQVMLMGGFNGAGCDTVNTGTTGHKSCQARIWPSSTNTINWERDVTGGSLSDANSTVMVVEWGSAWTVQRVNVTGSAGGNGADATGEYNTATINPVARNNTWVWGTGWTNDGGIGDAAEGTLITLGDGVNQNATETTVAVGQEYSDTRSFEVYALTHNDLAVDYQFKSDGDSTSLTYDVSTDTVSTTTARMAISYNGCNGTGGAFPRPLFSARYYDDSTIRLERRRSGQAFPAWVQGIDFSAIQPYGSCSGTATVCTSFGAEGTCSNQDGCSWGGGTSGNTTNANLDTNSTGWTYSDWGQGGGEVNVTGTWQPSGGNSNGYVDVSFPTGKRDELGGYWEQSFTTTVASQIANLDFDWFVSQYASAPNTFQLYVFVDTSSGVPTIGQEVWSSGEISSTQAWSTISDIDVLSNVTTAGTYYLKIAVWLETPGTNTGPFTIGYDNIYLDWSGGASCGGTATACSAFSAEGTCGNQDGCSWAGGTGSYPTDEPDIYPFSSYTALGVSSWDSFTETATKNGGAINYQLSSDDGTTWQYWDGSSWATAGALNYNSAAVVNTNISSFSTSTEQIKFKGFLDSDGTQLVQLDNIQVGLTPSPTVWSFSDWGVGGGEVTPTGTKQSSGGMPDSYVNITVPQGNNDEVGGYWEQSFTTTANNPTATLDFDYKIFEYTGTPNIAEIRMFIDAAAGDPVSQVGSSITVSGTTNWASSTQIDLSSALATPGTYYLKMALWVETGSNNGPVTIGFDNINLDWSSSNYPSDRPTIYNTNSFEPAQITEWLSFTATTTTTGGAEVFYQLSDDDGTNWQYWNGDNWAIDPDGDEGAMENDYNTATTTNYYINQFSVTNKKLMFKAFLVSDGSQQLQLEDIRVDYKISEPEYYGNQFFAENFSGIGAMSKSTDSTSLRFTPLADKTINSIRIYLETEQGTSPIYRYGLQADSGGEPSGTWLGATNTGYADYQATGVGWQNISLNENVALASSSAYHLVVQHQSGTVNGSNYIDILRSDPDNFLLPYDNTPDPESNTLFSNSGGAWEVQGYQPIYILGYTDATYEGNPYTQTNINQIYGTNYYGEQFTLDANTHISSAEFYISENNQGPEDNCYLVLYDVTNGQELNVGTITDPSQVRNGSYTWVRFDFPTVTTLIAGDTYRLYLRSPGSGITAHYLVMSVANDNNTTLNSLNYDGTNSYFTSSNDSGTSWSTTAINEDIAGFRFGKTIFLGSGYLISSAYDTGTTSAFSAIEWDQVSPTCSPACTVKLQIQTAPDNAGAPGTWSATWSGPDGEDGDETDYYTINTGELIHTDHNLDQWIRYKATLEGDSTDTPVLEETRIYYK